MSRGCVPLKALPCRGPVGTLRDTVPIVGDLHMKLKLKLKLKLSTVVVVSLVPVTPTL